MHSSFKDSSKASFFLSGSILDGDIGPAYSPIYKMLPVTLTDRSDISSSSPKFRFLSYSSSIVAMEAKRAICLGVAGFTTYSNLDSKLSSGTVSY
jgi:hypothetical protein